MIFTIAGKELKALFSSPLAWIVLTLLQLILSFGFLKRLDDFMQIQPQLMQAPNPPGVTELVVVPVYDAADRGRTAQSNHGAAGIGAVVDDRNRAR